MKTKYYHLLSDRKTVKEITFDDWSHIVRVENSKVTRARLVCRVSKHEIYFRQGKKSMWLAISQVGAIIAKT